MERFYRGLTASDWEFCRQTFRARSSQSNMRRVAKLPLTVMPTVKLAAKIMVAKRQPERQERSVTQAEKTCVNAVLAWTLERAPTEQERTNHADVSTVLTQADKTSENAVPTWTLERAPTEQERTSHAEVSTVKDSNSQQKEPLMKDPAPKRVFESVSADFFNAAGKCFLVYVDRLSGWPVVATFPRDATARELVSTLRKIFASTGAPNVLRLDGGPLFTARVTMDFMRRWQVD